VHEERSARCREIIPQFFITTKNIVRFARKAFGADEILKSLVGPFSGRQAGCSRPATPGIGLPDLGATTFTFNTLTSFKKEDCPGVTQRI